MNRPLYYALAVVGAFAALGAGVGLAANFTLGFFIEQFVEPGEDPLESIQVGIMFLTAIFLAYGLGPVAAGVAGIGVGQALPDRETTASVVGGVGSFVGFYLFVGLALFFTFSVLGEYGTPPGGSGEAGEGGGGGGPLEPSALLTLMVQVSLPVALVGLATAYITSRVTTAGGGSAARGAGPGPGTSDTGVETASNPGATSARDQETVRGADPQSTTGSAAEPGAGSRTEGGASRDDAAASRSDAGRDQ